jgi:hypothetical protein
MAEGTIASIDGTAADAAVVEVGVVVVLELVVVVVELLPHAAIAPMHITRLGATNQFLQLPNCPSPCTKTDRRQDRREPVGRAMR